jgi:hypothetical protein
MRPVRIFLFFLLLFLFFALLSMLIPGNRVVLSRNLAIKIPAAGNLFRSETRHYANITPILQIESKPDTVSVRHTDLTHPRPVALSQDKVVQPIEYPGNDKSVLFPFFDHLAAIRDSKQGFHVLHFGDSQLEGDRITDYLRARFQKEFGGSGPGLIPLSDEPFRQSLHTTTSGAWKRYSGLGVLDKSLPKGIYGPLGSIFRYKTFAEDTTGPVKPETSTITFSLAGTPSLNLRNFSRLKLFYAHVRKPVFVELKDEENLLSSDSISPGGDPAEFDYSFKAIPGSFTLRFTGTASPDFYAASLDSPEGISFDNIPLRGSSGLEFTRMSRQALQFILRSLNAKLLILEFGVNVLPNPAEDYSYYRTGFYNQLMYLKGIDPELSIIVISVSDASVKNGNDYESYPNVVKIVEAQRAAALKAGCAFWDLYDAMGGKNSMPGWVFANPPLATTDFIHFNYSGARIVGKMFYDALISDYNEYIAGK